MALRNTDAFQQSRRSRKKVEMLFAHMKQQYRFNRLKLRGLAGAAEEFLLVATVQNLRRLVRRRPPAIPQASCLSTAWAKNTGGSPISRLPGDPPISGWRE
jgi:hypothetical protein